MSGCQGAAAEPHPLLVQLSALHHFHFQVDVAVVVVVLALANVIAHFTTGSVFQLVPVATSASPGSSGAASSGCWPGY